ncbi:MAG TPA: DUF2442 domain-containing protein [bacterium]|nr:DUF2442 domain-containing protein [bacterium]
MKSHKLGKGISGAEIQNISSDGIWLLVAGREYFLDYDRYPWFRKATVDEIANVKLLGSNHLHWPDLDVDLEIDSLEHPEKYPLTYR